MDKCLYAAAKSLQSCLTLCDPKDGSPTGSPVPGILQARTLEWVAISLSNSWKWKVKVKLLSRVRLVVTTWTAAYQAPPSMGFPGKSTGVGCHRLLWNVSIPLFKAIEYTTPRVSPNVNSGLLVKMWYQSKFIDCNKCTLWCRMLIVGEVVCVCMGRGRYENSLYFPLNFSLNLKLLPKIKSIKKLKKKRMQFFICNCS